MKMYGFQFFCTFKNHLTTGFIRKNQLKYIGTAVIMLYLCYKQLKRFESYLDFICQSASLPAYLSAVSPLALGVQLQKFTQQR